MVRRRHSYCCSILLAFGFGSLLSTKGMQRRINNWRRRRGIVAFGIVGTNRPVIRILRGGGGLSSSSLPVYDDEEEDDDEEMEVEEDEDEDNDADNQEDADTTESTLKSSVIKPPPAPAKPVVLTIQTSSGSSVLDQMVELENVVPTRTIESIKISISKKLPAKPPPSILALRYEGRLLADNELVQDIVKEAMDEHEDDDEDESETTTTDKPRGIVLTMDTIVPVDPKSLPELERKIPDLTSEELLQAYTANEAALYQTSLLLEGEVSPKVVVHDPKEENDEPNQYQELDLMIPVNVVIRDRMARIRADLADTILATENAKTLLADNLSPNARRKQQQVAKIEIKGQRIRYPGKSVAVRGILQRSLNIRWYPTARAVMVLLFFGIFGGRTSLSKAILLLCAPMLLIVQLRPIKAQLTQLMYTILLHPPSVILTLLPVPQQTLLTMDFDTAMKDIYGNQIKQPIQMKGDDELSTDNVDDDYDDQEELEDIPDTAENDDVGDDDDMDMEDEYDSDENDND